MHAQLRSTIKCLLTKHCYLLDFEPDAPQLALTQMETFVGGMITWDGALIRFLEAMFTGHCQR